MLPSQRHLFDIPRDVAYLNAAAWSPLPLAVQEAGRAGVARKGRPWELDPGLGAFQHERCRAAAAALIGLLSRGAGPGQTEFTLRQGHEMGRPSTIQLQLRIDDGKLTHGGIGGDAIIIGEGVLELDD